ncbi:hypothetical protein [Bacillus sp. FJAT-28004]|uniref:hypothetical protein n=1 Tax=Bacillus sp. FJAT-28004 TaxID=1679165 RepID=UPI0006B5CBC8|nr:hypothetical protein [Bacillus sp. FJAT-28004]
MIRNRSINIALFAGALLLIIFQALFLGVAAPKDYYLIHDWIFYGINYIIIIFLFFLLYSKNEYIRWIQWMLGLILLVINTSFFYYMGDVNVVVSKSPDKQHELILKEYKKMNYETVRLKRKGLFFGKQTVAFKGSSTYKTIEEEAFQINWVSGDTAVVTYLTSGNGTLQQRIFSFRNADYISYKYVAVSLTGKWLEQDNPHNYIMYNGGEIVYAKDGQLYYYSDHDTEQQGIFSLVIKGDEKKPSFTVVLNADCIFGDDGLIKDGGTITLSPITFEESEGKVYYKQ